MQAQPRAIITQGIRNRLCVFIAFKRIGCGTDEQKRCRLDIVVCCQFTNINMRTCGSLMNIKHVESFPRQRWCYSLTLTVGLLPLGSVWIHNLLLDIASLLCRLMHPLMELLCHLHSRHERRKLGRDNIICGISEKGRDSPSLIVSMSISRY